MYLKQIYITLYFIQHHPWAKKYLFIAICKWLFWQLKSRLFSGPFKIRLIDSTYFIAYKKDYGLTGNIYTGLHDFEDMCFTLHFLKAGDVFYDVGANAGIYTLLASGVRKAKSYAFEPIKNTIDKLRANINLNNIQNLCTILPYAISDNNDSLVFIDDENTTNQVYHHELGKSTVIIEASSLDSFELECPKLLKIDVEGYECKVLQGAHQILENPTLKAIIIELNGSGKRYDFDENQIHHRLNKLGFEKCDYDPYKRKLFDSKNLPASNSLYVRKKEEVNVLLNKASPFKLWNNHL